MDQFDLNALALSLIDEYVVIKERWKAGGRKFNIEAMLSDRERAGLWLKVSGRKAVEAYDSMLALVPGVRDPHPGARHIIVQALESATPS